MSDPSAAPDTRGRLELAIARNLRALSSSSEQLGRAFAGLHELGDNDFRALLHISTAESAGAPLTAGDLGRLLGVSPAAVTYLVERMVASGHIRREPSAVDRRRVLLHYTEHGMEVAGAFFGPLGARMHATLAELPDDDLAAADRVFTAVIAAQRAHYDTLARGKPQP